jgi:hypothetical protein
VWSSLLHAYASYTAHAGLRLVVHNWGGGIVNPVRKYGVDTPASTAAGRVLLMFAVSLARQMSSELGSAIVSIQPTGYIRQMSSDQASAIGERRRQPRRCCHPSAEDSRCMCWQSQPQVSQAGVAVISARQTYVQWVAAAQSVLYEAFSWCLPRGKTVVKSSSVSGSCPW